MKIRSTSRKLLRLSLAALVAAASTKPGAALQQDPWFGLSPRGAMVVEEAGAGQAPASGDGFGLALAAGDFNQDGYDDLASGIPGNDCSATVRDCGSVQLRFGWAFSPLFAPLTLDPAAEGAPDPADADDRYGAALAVGDFNHDGYDDLAVGAPGDRDLDDAGDSFAGAVQIHYGLHGSLGSIQWVAEHHLVQGGAAGVPGEDHQFEYFGRALAAGDFNGDGHDDLAIGAPQNLAATSNFAGNVVVAHGHVGGLVPFEGFEMELGLTGLPDVPENGEEFGHALAAGDFNGDGFDDLAIGVPGEDGSGRVLAVYGSEFSLLFAAHWYITQGQLGEADEPDDRFGETLATGDFNGDGYDDLAIGTPLEDGGDAGRINMGMVTVLYGSSNGLQPGSLVRLSEDMLLLGLSEASDLFGSALAAGDFNGDGIDDLAVGVRGENGLTANDGSAFVLLGAAPAGLSGVAARRLYPGDPERGLIPDASAANSWYGSTLAAGDFDGNGFGDLAIAAPERDLTGLADDAGRVAILFGALFHDGFEFGDTSLWSAEAP